MTIENSIFLVIGTLLFATIVVCIYFGKDYLRYHKIFSPILEVLCNCVKGISGMMPNNTSLSILAIVLGAAVEATEMAETLWLNGTIDKEQRNLYAKNYIASVLEKAQINVDNNINMIVDGVIAFVCYLLPHGQSPKIEEEEA